MSEDIGGNGFFRGGTLTHCSGRAAAGLDPAQNSASFCCGRPLWGWLLQRAQALNAATEDVRAVPRPA
jgi:hypothetical protein